MFFKIYAGLAGGFGGGTYCKTEEYDSDYEAEADAYESAVAAYESYKVVMELYLVMIFERI